MFEKSNILKQIMSGKCEHMSERENKIDEDAVDSNVSKRLKLCFSPAKQKSKCIMHFSKCPKTLKFRKFTDVALARESPNLSAKISCREILYTYGIVTISIPIPKR